MCNTCTLLNCYRIIHNIKITVMLGRITTVHYDCVRVEKTNSVALSE